MRKIEITFCGIQFESELQKLEEYEATVELDSGSVPNHAVVVK